MPDLVTIRRATKADIPAVQRLSLALFEDPTSAADKFSDHTWSLSDRGRQAFESGLEPGGLLLVAGTAGELVGYLSAEITTLTEWRPIKRAELMSFYVVPGYRSQGIGARLTEQFLSWSREQRATTAFVSAYANNERGIAFYQKMGFRPESLVLEIEL